MNPVMTWLVFTIIIWAQGSSGNGNKYPTLTTDDVAQFAWQVGGHGSQPGKELNAGMLRDKKTNHLLKKMPKPKNGEDRADAETQFYETLSKTEAGDPLHELLQFTPTYFGKKTYIVNGEVMSYLEMEDATANMKKPNVADIKIGGITYGPDANAEKIKANSNYPYSKEIGFRFVGMILYRGEGKVYEIKDRQWGYSVEPSQVQGVLGEYFDANGEDKSAVIDAILAKLVPLEEWFTRTTGWHFIGSSILIVYDAASDPKHIPKVEVRMIDFAHVYSNQKGHDENYLYGIRNLIHQLEMYKNNLGYQNSLDQEKGLNSQKGLNPQKGMTADIRL